MFIELLLKNWKLIVAAVLLAIIAGLGVYIRILKGDVATLNAKMETTKAELSVSQASVKSLQIALDDQNDAIDKMQIDANNREKAHAAELAAAKASTVTAQKRAKDLMASVAPKNLSKCDSASQLIDQEIQRVK